MHVEAGARRGSAEYQAILASVPELPEGMDYLLSVARRLDEMRDWTEHGPKRFTPTHIRDGAALFGWTLTPMEAEAIVLVDRVMLSVLRDPDQPLVEPVPVDDTDEGDD